MPYPPIEDDPRLTAFALGEIDEEADRAEVEARLANDPEAAAFVEDVRRMARILTEEFHKEHATPPALDPARRQAVEREMAAAPAPKPLPLVGTFRLGLPRIRPYALAAAALVAVGGIGVVLSQQGEQRRLASTNLDTVEAPAPALGSIDLAQQSPLRPMAPAPAPAPGAPIANYNVATTDELARGSGDLPVDRQKDFEPSGAVAGLSAKRARDFYDNTQLNDHDALMAPAAAPAPALAMAPASDPARGNRFTMRGGAPRSAILAPGEHAKQPEAEAEKLALLKGKDESLARRAQGTDERQLPGRMLMERLGEAGPPGDAVLEQAKRTTLGKPNRKALEAGEGASKGEPAPIVQELQGEAKAEAEAELNREAFTAIVENPFVRVVDQPLSTFGVDVDTASYANVRRFLIGENRMPPPDAVRIEEMVNYFRYDDAPPRAPDDRPFSVNVEFARCPWEPDHRLVRVGLKGKEVSIANRPPSNLVFLIDVSGSMREYNKLPWVKESLRMLVEKLVENDRVAIVVYAGTKGLALPSTTGDRKDLILNAIDRLEAGGSTNGGEGLRLAYDLAQKEFVNGGINRIILCTDGDFNTGDVTDLAAVTRLAEEKRATKVKLTVLGFGQGNLQDDKLQALANRGDGQYAYIDTLKEAHRVLVEQMSGTLLTIARDVKLQLDFNPRFVGAYRLLGYENRILQAQDFRDDTKDAGEIGSGHTVTALYELVPPGKEATVPAAEPSKFQEPSKLKDDDLSKTATMIVNLRYKAPDGDVSTGFDLTATDPGGDYANASTDFRFAASVAEFGLLLRQSKFAGQATYEAVLELAQASQGDNPPDDRREFLDLVRRARDLSKPRR